MGVGSETSTKIGGGGEKGTKDRKNTEHDPSSYNLKSLRREDKNAEDSLRVKKHGGL